MGDEQQQNDGERVSETPAAFNPSAFNAAEWVAMVKAAGMRYITITSKHHDGFAMWGTRQSKWNIVDTTPYAKDPLKMFADECRKQGIKLFFYHSHLDWTIRTTIRCGRTGHNPGRAPKRGMFNRISITWTRNSRSC